VSRGRIPGDQAQIPGLCLDSLVDKREDEKSSLGRGSTLLASAWKASVKNKRDVEKVTHVQGDEAQHCCPLPGRFWLGEKGLKKSIPGE
jgi:hypothetical protein